MRLNYSIGILIICLFLGCSIFKKDTTNTPVAKVKEEKENVSDTVASYSAVVPVDTVVLPAPPKEPLEYMTIEEKAMINEINILRSDPGAYIQHIDNYLQDFLQSDDWGISMKQEERIAAEQLIRELRTMPPLPILQYSEELYNVAMKHGQDMKKSDLISHRGSDDSMPKDRIRDSTSLIGSENLVAGGLSVRESLIILLVDANDRLGRGHRRTILNPVWEFIACYDAGKINETPNAWVQLFGYTDPSDIPEEVIVEPSTNPEIEKPVTTTGTSTSDDNVQMTANESGMIAEINLMRTNPKGYIKYVDEYVTEMKKVMVGKDRDFDKAVKEIKKTLKKMRPLSALKAHDKLYGVAKAHGLDNKNHNQLEHQGTDGRSSFDRVKDSGLKNSINKKGIFAPNENLAGGEATARNTVITLLIDSGISTRGHRKALIEPSWEYVACYNIGTIENLKDLQGMEDPNMPHCWVQVFAKGPDDNAVASTETSGNDNGSKPSKSKPDVATSSTSKPKKDDTRPTRSKPTSSTGSASGDFSFMNTEEKAMIEEINLMRTNPKAYVQHVDAYVKEMKTMMVGGDPDFDKAVSEIKGLLNTMPSLSALQPHKKLHGVATAHGVDNKTHNQLEHQGTNGRSSFDRVKDSGLKNSINAQGIFAPNENLAGGEATVRNTVITLLIDSGISSRGHRKALIEPSWGYVACYNIGTIKNLKDLRGMQDPDMPHCWVQVFAKGPDDNPAAGASKPASGAKPSTSKPEVIPTSSTDPASKPVVADKPEIAKPKTSKASTNSTADGDFSFMTADEKAMIEEINLIRTNPKGYIQHVDTYVKEMKTMMVGDDPDFDKAVNEIKSILKTMPSLSVLQPHKKLHSVATAHGIDNKSHNQLEHQGTNGRKLFR